MYKMYLKRWSRKCKKWVEENIGNLRNVDESYFRNVVLRWPNIENIRKIILETVRNVNERL